jgi:uncharacterized protein
MAIRLDLDDLCLRGGDRHQSVYAFELAPITLGGTHYRALLPRGVEIVVDRVAGGYLVNVSTEVKVYGPCARCLCEAAMELRAEEQEFAPTAGGTWDEADVSPFIEELVVDIEGLAREAVILALPGQVLCALTCKGLCAQCGRDLNLGDCGCEALEISQQMG